MITALILFTIIGFLGAFDTLYHHEFKERLPWRPEVQDELKIHALRNVFYFIIFISLAWIEWHGILAWVFLAILLAEVFVTFTDFALEGKVRDVPSPEIIIHALLGIVYGAALAYLIPEVLGWTNAVSGFNLVNHGLLSWVMTAYALAVLVFAFRDHFRSLEVDNFKQTYAISLKEKKQQVLITGGSGFIGSKVAQALIEDGHEVSILTRSFKTTAQKFSKQLTLLESLDEVENAYEIILNLAGSPINQRWNKENREKIVKSRLTITQEVVKYIQRIDKKPKLLISSSGTGIYEESLTEEFNELSALSSSSFTAEVCKAWEAEAQKAEKYGVRVVPLRTGLVLATDGGVLSQMLPAFDLCLGGKLGSGKQMMPWIDMQDMLGVIEHIINNNELEGVVNATAPMPVNNLVFSKSLAKAMRRPILLPTPVFMLNLLYGKEMVQELLLEGRSVYPVKVQERGYEFKFKTLEASMNNLFKGEKNAHN
ncbi:MAG: Cell division inhibitor [uncultured Sulfurovum sp.]|uniref:Cell division inhibitor n=1 Tax=uncultured Sulfurovum sp. TaxID=269237 RepID=A0A6S6S6Y4_9BACT|nr:MAG: Cell division inhibitor [uncultured Sulfurovum sp.]